MPVAAAPDAALPRAERLRGGAELERLFRRGARVERPCFVLLFLPAGGTRAVAFAASRRLGGSVSRNRARRRLREAYRRHKGLLPCHVRLCIVARPRILEEPFAGLTREMAAALRQVARRVSS